jgi:hypothetical protein
MYHLFESYLISICLVVFWLLATFKPKWLGKKNLGAQNKITKRSVWMKAEANRFAQQFLRYTALPAAMLPLLFENSISGLYLSVYVWLGIGCTYLYSRRLKRQWDLWQQLGYDGPPALEKQQAQLQQTGPRAVNLPVQQPTDPLQ